MKLIQEEYLEKTFDRLTYNMLQYNNLDNLVSVKVDNKNIYYSVEGLIPILEYYSEPVRKKDIIYILSEIIDNLEVLKYYLIGEEFLKGALEHIYISSENILVLTVSPKKGDSLSIKKIFQEMILNFNFSSEENNNYILEINKYLLSGTYTLQGLKRFITRIDLEKEKNIEYKNENTKKTLAKNSKYGNIDNVVKEKKTKKRFFFFNSKENQIQKKDLDFEFQIPNKKL